MDLEPSENAATISIVSRTLGCDDRRESILTRELKEHPIVARHSDSPAALGVIAHILRIKGVCEDALGVVDVAPTAGSGLNLTGNVCHVEVGVIAAHLEVQPQFVGLGKRLLPGSK